MTARAQPQYERWYFGFFAGLDFSGGAPQAVTGAMQTDEGVASISDAAGNLLFYTNGSEVYNNQHQIMPNGTGLSGHFSSSQSALVVQSQSDSSQYYLFTAPAQLTGDFCYSVIDMDLNGALGDVISKNNILLSDVCEKLTAVLHANKRSVWVVVRSGSNNDYYSFPVDCNGIGTPVISQSGTALTHDFLSSTGCMKISRDGTKIASTWPVADNSDSYAYLEIADFDNRSGMVSNPVTIIHGNSGLIARGYGVEFSPSSQYLYYSESGLNNGIGYSRLYQYDVTNPSPVSTETLIANEFLAMGSMQIGPDNKIYIARLNGSKNLSIVHAPDASGLSCQFDAAGVSLDTNFSTWGLPNNWNTFETPNEEIFYIDDTLICGGSLMLTAIYPYPEEVTGYNWNTGSNDSVISVDTTGIYAVSIFLQCDTISDSIFVATGELEFALPEDTVLCNSETMRLVAPPGFIYQWSNGSSSESIIVQDTGLYIVTITDSLGCALSDSILLTDEGCGCGVYIPSAVTINNDGINDMLSVYSDCDFNTFSITIFNRWGEAVFKTSDPGFTWNGSYKNATLSQNIYAYVLEYSSKDLITRDVVKKAGTIAFIR